MGPRTEVISKGLEPCLRASPWVLYQYSGIQGEYRGSWVSRVVPGAPREGDGQSMDNSQHQGMSHDAMDMDQGQRNGEDKP